MLHKKSDPTNKYTGRVALFNGLIFRVTSNELDTRYGMKFGKFKDFNESQTRYCPAISVNGQVLAHVS